MNLTLPDIIRSAQSNPTPEVVKAALETAYALGQRDQVLETMRAQARPYQSNVPDRS
jgi:hypothetical protein